jgi:hypothetical protein
MAATTCSHRTMRLDHSVSTAATTENPFFLNPPCQTRQDEEAL